MVLHQVSGRARPKKRIGVPESVLTAPPEATAAIIETIGRRRLRVRERTGLRAQIRQTINDGRALAGGSAEAGRGVVPDAATMGSGPATATGSVCPMGSPVPAAGRTWAGAAAL